MITPFDTPAAQQAMPYQAPEPLAAYGAALSSLQGRFDKAYQSNRQTESAISSLQVRGIDEPSKQAYVNTFKGQVQRVLDSHGGNYGAAANELDALANWITSDGNLAGMNSLYGQAAKVQEERAKNPDSHIDFNMDLFSKRYFNNDGSTNKNLGYQSEERQDIIKPMKDIFETLEATESHWFKKYAQNPAYYESYHGADKTIQEIRDHGRKNFTLYSGTKGGNQRIRELSQIALRTLTGGKKAYLNDGSEAELNVARSVGQQQALAELLSYGDGYKRHKEEGSLIYDQDFARRAKDAKEAQEKVSAQLTSGQQIPISPTAGTNANGNILGDDDLQPDLQGLEDSRRYLVGKYGQGALDAGAAASAADAQYRKEHPIMALLGGAPGAYAGGNQPLAPVSQLSATPLSENKARHIRALLSANGTAIFGKDAADVQARFEKQGLNGLLQSERKKFQSWYKQEAPNIPLNKMQSANIKTISPNDVHLPGYEAGERSYNYAIFGNGKGTLKEANASLPIFDEKGTLTTLGALQQAYKTEDPKTPTINANIMGFVTQNSGNLLATAWGTKTNRFVKLNIGGQTYFTFAPDQQVTNTSQRQRDGSVTTTPKVENFGNLNPYQQSQLQGYKDLVGGGRAKVGMHPIPGRAGWQASYDLRPTIIDPELGVLGSRGHIILRSPKGETFDEGEHDINDFFNQPDATLPGYGGMGAGNITNGEAYIDGLIMKRLGAK
jgi:hypothetical protein